MDLQWWHGHIKEVRQTFKGELYTPQRGCFEARQVRVSKYLNSGAAAIELAADMGAKRIILLGYDCQHTGGKRHWHGDHPKGAGSGNAGNIAKWPAIFNRLARSLKGVEVINCTRETALTCFPRASLEGALIVDNHSDLAVAGQSSLSA